MHHEAEPLAVQTSDEPSGGLAIKQDADYVFYVAEHLKAASVGQVKAAS